jgi:hypothetical protein
VIAATTESVAQRWAALKANADALADLETRSRALWRPIARDMAALRDAYPANQEFSKALADHGIEFDYNARAAYIWLGENLLTDQAWTEALALSPRESVRTFCDAVKASLRPKPSSQGCENATTTRSTVPPAQPAASVRQQVDDLLALERERLRIAEEKARAKEARYYEKLQGQPIRLSKAEFDLIRSCLHPDREADEERKRRAFQMFTDKARDIKWPKEAKQ